MKLIAAGLLLLLLAFSCSRQPLGIDSSAPAVKPVPANPGVQNRESVDRRNERATAGPRAADDDMEQQELPAQEEVKASRREQLRLRRQGMLPPPIESNETATIENQGNVGQAPLTDPEQVEADVESAEAPPAFSFRKSNCFGDCEAYTFDLRSGGMTSLLVDKGEIAQGLYNRQLYSVDYDRLNNDIDSLRQLDLAPLYPVDEDIPADIPYREVSLFDEEGEARTIRVYYGAPPALQRFLDRLEALIEEQSWQKADHQYQKN